MSFCHIIWVIILLHNSVQDKADSERMATSDELNEETYSMMNGLLDEESLIEHELEIRENRLDRKAFPTNCHGISSSFLKLVC